MSSGTETPRTDGDRPKWYSGPVDPGELEPYFEWLLDEFQGSLVESIGGDAYYVEVTRLRETQSGRYDRVEGARSGGDDDGE